jgi:hypothetical protein
LHLHPSPLSFNSVALDQLGREALVEALGIVEIGLAEEIQDQGVIWERDQAEGDQAEGDQAEGDQAEGDQAEGDQAEGGQAEVPLAVFQVEEVEGIQGADDYSLGKT